MTTIAWDGQLLAADSMGDQNGLVMPVTKLHRGVLTDGAPFILGCAGETSWARLLHQWIKTLSLETLEATRYPYQVNDGSERNDPQCILVLGKFGVFYKVQSMLIKLEREFHSIGSGRDFAIAAMALGKDAHEAVQLAIKLDCYSGGKIKTMELGK